MSSTEIASLEHDSMQEVDAQRSLQELFRNLRTSPGYPPRGWPAGKPPAGWWWCTVLLSRPIRGGRRWPGELLSQFTQPLAILLALSAVLAWAGGAPALSLAVLAVILLDAGFAFVQEMQAERVVEALAAFLAATAWVLRDGVRRDIPARDLVPGTC